MWACCWAEGGCASASCGAFVVWRTRCIRVSGMDGGRAAAAEDATSADGRLHCARWTGEDEPGMLKTRRVGTNSVVVDASSTQLYVSRVCKGLQRQVNLGPGSTFTSAHTLPCALCHFPVLGPLLPARWSDCSLPCALTAPGQDGRPLAPTPTTSCP